MKSKIFNKTRGIVGNVDVKLYPNKGDILIIRGRVFMYDNSLSSSDGFFETISRKVHVFADFPLKDEQVHGVVQEVETCVTVVGAKLQQCEPIG